MIVWRDPTGYSVQTCNITLLVPIACPTIVSIMPSRSWRDTGHKGPLMPCVKLVCAVLSDAFDMEGATLDQNKYYWALAEMIAAAGLLAQRTGTAAYWEWYDKAWVYAKTTFIDTERGGGYPIGQPRQRKSGHARRTRPRRAACQLLFIEERLPSARRVLRSA